jgi:hypothetical protein
VVAPSSDQRRVLIETFPRFPRPWQQVTGQALSDGVQWGVLTLEAIPKLQLRLLVESKNTAAAEQLKQIVDSSLTALAKMPEVQQFVPGADQILQLVKSQVDGKQISVSLSEDAKTLDAVTKPLLSAIAAARQSARRQQSMNNLKQIGLAMHNYHDKHKRFPPAASRDASGKPLLSWRVHLLPYMDQAALYKQFHLDEPWDSEHNRKLSETIPKVYVHPGIKLKPGMTTYVVPIGERTVFGGKESLRIRDIRDGTSNTIMVVNVTPDNAVIWTKPDDLEVSEKTPFAGLTNDVHKHFLTTFCDGSVRAITNATDPKMLLRLFQADDGQVVDYDQIK